MAKINFSKGDCVKGKKWSGAEIKGIYEYAYDDGSHCVLEVSSGKRFNVKEKELQMADEEEAKELKKLQKEKHLKLHDKADAVSTSKNLSPKKEENKSEELDIALAGDEEEEEEAAPIIDDEESSID